MKNTSLSRRELLASGAIVATGSTTSVSIPTIVEAPRLPCTIIASGLGAPYLKQIRDISPKINLLTPANDDEHAKWLPSADVLWGGFSPADIVAAKKLKWVQYPAAGVEGLLYPDFVKSSITLTNAKGCYAPEIAEHAFGLLFALSRNIALHIRMMKDHKWEAGPRPTELRGLTMGIVGLGGIGREVARRAKVMDMRVIAVDSEPMYGEHYHMVDEIAMVDDGLMNLLRTADVVVSCAPHTKRSEGMFGAEQFGAMKSTAWFINVSRGKLVQTPALVDVLKTGKIAGAGLDVTSPEPLPADHPLWDLPNVVVTPHIAGQSQLAYERTSGIFVENVRRYVNGLPLLNVVDKSKGY